MNQTPEQLARDNIDKQLTSCGWAIQDKKKINLSESLGVAVREYQTDVGPADYVLFVDKKPAGETAALLKRIKKEKNKDITSVILSGADHSMNRLTGARPVSEYTETMIGWILRRVKDSS